VRNWADQEKGRAFIKPNICVCSNRINSEFPCVPSCNRQALYRGEKQILYCTGDAVEGSIPVATRCKAWDCRRSITGTPGSNPTEGMVVCVYMSVICCKVKVSATS